AHVLDTVHWIVGHFAALLNGIGKIFDHQSVLVGSWDSDGLRLSLEISPHLDGRLAAVRGAESVVGRNHPIRAKQRVLVAHTGAHSAIQVRDHTARKMQRADEHLIDASRWADNLLSGDSIRLLARHHSADIDAVAAHIPQTTTA